MSEQDNEPDTRRLAAAAGLNEGDQPEEEQTELFPDGYLAGGDKTLKTLVKANQPIEHTVSMRAAEVPLRDGLFDPDIVSRAFVTLQPQKYEEIPQREDGRTVSWKVRQIVRPVYVEPVEGDGAALVERLFMQVMEESPTKGGALAERIGQIAAGELQQA